MTEVQYIHSHHPDGIADTGCSPEHHLPEIYLPPYTEPTPISSYPAITEASLPTPISNAGSPALSQRADCGAMTHYPSPQLPPSPPSTTYWTTQAYAMNGSTSQTSSPGMVHAQIADTSFDMGYVNAEPISPTRGEIPQPYFGSFGVSEPGQPEGPAQTMPPFTHSYPPTLDDVYQPHIHAQQTPLQPQLAPRMAVLAPHPPAINFQLEPVPYAVAPSTHRVAKKRTSRPSKKAATLRTNGAVGADGSFAAEAQPKKKAMLNLKPGAPAEVQHLMELRIKHEADKGKGMWDIICNEFGQKFGHKERPALQMQINRLIMKWGEWPKQEDDALIEALKYVQENKWKFVLDVMKEKGGCQAWDWKPKNIRKRAIELGLEDMSDDDSSKNRRKRKATRRRSSAVNAQGYNAADSCLQSQQLGFDMSITDGSAPQGVQMSSEKEDELIERLMKEEVESEHGSDRIDSTIPEAPEPLELRQHIEEYRMDQDHSERIARQACEQLIAQHHHHQQRI